jgi:hypothetical protein
MILLGFFSERQNAKQKNNQNQTSSNKNNEFEPCYGCGAQLSTNK